MNNPDNVLKVSIINIVLLFGCVLLGSFRFARCGFFKGIGVKLGADEFRLSGIFNALLIEKKSDALFFRSFNSCRTVDSNCSL